MCNYDEVEERQLYVVLRSKYHQKTEGKLVYLLTENDRYRGRWTGPWYWGWYKEVESGRRLHNKVILKKHTILTTKTQTDDKKTS